ncbi:MAG: ATP-binding cassette domain-containing protein [Armatimonadaceae bacterium]
MPVALLSCQSLTKTNNARPLFEGVSFGIEEGDRVGLIGPNGSGKSTLLRILAGDEKPDNGAVAPRKGLRMVYVPQEESLPTDCTVEQTLRDALAGTGYDDTEKDLQIEMALAQASFPDRAQQVQHLSGGWRKRLAIAHALIQEPELLLLDEPTNHLDLDSVLWLEELLATQSSAVLFISHDRVFLENVATRILELNPAYEGGSLMSDGAYSDFLEKREAYLERQAQRQQSLAGVVRREIEWLRRGAQARTTKAKGRIGQAGELIKELGDLKQRNTLAQSTVGDMAFAASGRQTKEMISLSGVGKSLGGRQLFHDVEFIVSPKRRIGLVGPNGSGKTTLLRLLTGEIEPDTGTVRRADNLQIVWFEQDRSALEQTKTLKDALSPNSDNVNFRGGSMHVSGYARRFLFRSEQMTQPVHTLSGGEQARLLIAKLMLQPADLLILDEPTNDLDIPSLEVLEEGLTSFPGAVVLVTHDRYLLERVSTEVLGIMEDGTVRLFADYEQYAMVRESLKTTEPTPEPRQKQNQKEDTPPVARVPLTASERRELAQMEETILQAEATVEKWEASLVAPEVATDPAKLQEAWNQLEAAKAAVAALYTRWEELEAKQTAFRGE